MNAWIFSQQIQENPERKNMGRRRKAADPCPDPLENVTSQAEDVTSKSCNSRSSALTSHYSLEDFTRLKKQCKEDDASTEPVVSHTSRLVGIATAPPCGTSSLVFKTQNQNRRSSSILSDDNGSTYGSEREERVESVHHITTTILAFGGG
ncbi:hypothetical protein EV1_024544 [Malus domestica]|uniref:Uncharacterized protein n=1 Tax=Malus domestica TaxID=3750 RepID=A0A498H9D1_MALDO|nr:hypothetical protein DVH24_027577 [Malus domestica]